MTLLETCSQLYSDQACRLSWRSESSKRGWCITRNADGYHRQIACQSNLFERRELYELANHPIDTWTNLFILTERVKALTFCLQVSIKISIIRVQLPFAKKHFGDFLRHSKSWVLNTPPNRRLSIASNAQIRALSQEARRSDHFSRLGAQASEIISTNKLQYRCGLNILDRTIVGQSDNIKSD